jgi:hypothetical protein
MILKSSLVSDTRYSCDRGTSPSERGQWACGSWATTLSAPSVVIPTAWGLKETFTFVCSRSP